MIKNKFRRLLLIASCIIMVGCATTRPMAIAFSTLMCGDPQGSNVLLGPNTDGMYDKQWSAAIKFCTDEELYSDMCKGYYTTPYIEKILDKGRCLTYVEQLKAQGLLRQDYEYTGGSTTTTPTYTQEEIDAAWEESERKEPTCAEDGYISYKNKLTGKTSLETLTATGHDYQTDTTVDATCIEEGKISYKCIKCEDTYEEEIPMVDHTYVEEIKAGSCEEDSIAIYTCSVCGDTYEESIPAKGHTKGEWVVTKEPTVFAEGEKSISCTSCGKALETEVIEKEAFPVAIVGVAIVAVTVVVVGFEVMRRKKK